jgi:hypothetical protein
MRCQRWLSTFIIQMRYQSDCEIAYSSTVVWLNVIELIGCLLYDIIRSETNPLLSIGRKNCSEIKLDSIWILINCEQFRMRTECRICSFVVCDISVAHETREIIYSKFIYLTISLDDWLKSFDPIAIAKLKISPPCFVVKYFCYRALKQEKEILKNLRIFKCLSAVFTCVSGGEFSASNVKIRGFLCNRYC